MPGRSAFSATAASFDAGQVSPSASLTHRRSDSTVVPINICDGRARQGAGSHQAARRLLSLRRGPASLGGLLRDGLDDRLTASVALPVASLGWPSWGLHCRLVTGSRGAAPLLSSACRLRVFRGRSRPEVGAHDRYARAPPDPEQEPHRGGRTGLGRTTCITDP